MSNHFSIVISIMQLMNIVHQCAVSLTIRKAAKMSKAAKMTAINKHTTICSSCILTSILQVIHPFFPILIFFIRNFSFNGLRIFAFLNANRIRRLF